VKILTSPFALGASTTWFSSWVNMRYLAIILITFMAGCTRQAPQPVSIPTAPTKAARETSTNVLAEPLPGRKVKISVTANDGSLYIINCNEHIVVSLREVGSPDIAWGGVSNACLSQSIIIPSKATLSFVVSLNNGSPELDTSKRYTAIVGGAHPVADIRSTPTPIERMTSNVFKIIP
jgi:hypothetical protein